MQVNPRLTTRMENSGVDLRNHFLLQGSALQGECNRLGKWEKMIQEVSFDHLLGHRANLVQLVRAYKRKCTRRTYLVLRSPWGARSLQKVYKIYWADISTRKHWKRWWYTPPWKGRRNSWFYTDNWFWVSRSNTCHDSGTQRYIREHNSNLIAQLQETCSGVFGEISVEIFDTIAPKICTHFNLVHHTAETSLVSPAMFKL